MKKSLLCSIVAAFLFMTLEPVSKLIAGQISPYAITFWRFALGSFILIPFAVSKIRKEQKRITLRDFAFLTFLGILFICISMVPLQYAVKTAESPALIAIIFSSSSVFTLLLAIPIVKEKMTVHKAIATVLCVIGLILSADFGQSNNWFSVCLALFSSVTFSIHSVLSQKYMTRLGASVQNCIIFLMGSLVLLIFLLSTGQDLTFAVQAKSLTILTYLGFAVTGFGYWIYFRAIETGGAMMGSLVFFIKPLLAPFATLVINRIVPDAKIFLALLFVMLGSVFATRDKKKIEEKQTLLKTRETEKNKSI